MEGELILFEPDNNNISVLKKILKKQGETACQNQIDEDYISNTLKDFRFGFISLSKKAQIGRRSLKDDSDKYPSLSDELREYYLNGFIICNVYENEPDEMIINLICSDKKAKIGKLLIEVAQNHAKEMKIKKIILYLLDENKLVKWYESLGFTKSGIIFTGKNIPKLNKMTKRI